MGAVKSSILFVYTKYDRAGMIGQAKRGHDPKWPVKTSTATKRKQKSSTCKFKVDKKMQPRSLARLSLELQQSQQKHHQKDEPKTSKHDLIHFVVPFCTYCKLGFKQLKSLDSSGRLSSLGKLGKGRGAT